MQRPKLETHLDAVIYFMQKMDADMISTLLEDNCTYQDFSKSIFIRKLGDLFYEFSQNGDFFLLVERGECFGCSSGCLGYSFIGNKSKSYVDIVFETNDDHKVIDIYECNDFFNKRSGVRKKNRLHLDNYVEYELDPDDDPFYDDSDEQSDEDMPF